MKLIAGRQLWEFTTIATELFNYWVSRKKADPTKELKAMITTVIMEGRHDDEQGVGTHVEGDMLHLAHAARAIARKLWKANPMLVMAFQDEVTKQAANELGSVVEEWARKRGILPREEGSDAPHSLDGEIAYGMYVAARKQGTSHATLLQIDPANDRHLARYAKEYGE